MSTISLPTIFISYSRTDNEGKTRWLDQLQMHLAPLVQQNRIRTFSDKDIELGDEWHERIQKELENASAAVILVSAAFLASEYIRSNELPILLQKAKARGVPIIPILVRPSAFESLTFRYPDPVNGPDELKLSTFQAANSPHRTLIDMDEGEWTRVLINVAERLKTLSNSNPP